MVHAMQETMATLQSALITVEHAVNVNTTANTELNNSVRELRTEMSLTYVRKDVLEPTLENIRTEVKEHSDWITWAMRIVISVIIVAVLGTVVITGK